MSGPVSRSGQRTERRRLQRRRTVRTIGALLAVLALVALGFAVYLAVDAPAPPGADQPRAAAGPGGGQAGAPGELGGAGRP